ncbi:MAG: hypothetical protein MPK75_00705 [Alphaproteobacteria bacterium]|nr:hypothetical protein [Alphaproteobacteria bacterium]
MMRQLSGRETKFMLVIAWAMGFSIFVLQYQLGAMDGNWNDKGMAGVFYITALATATTLALGVILLYGLLMRPPGTISRWVGMLK